MVITRSEVRPNADIKRNAKKKTKAETQSEIHAKAERKSLSTLSREREREINPLPQLRS